MTMQQRDTPVANGPVKGGAGRNPAQEGLQAETATPSRVAAGPVVPPPATTTPTASGPVKRAAPLAVLAALVYACAVWWPHVRDEFFVIAGNRDEAGGWYGWWSGNAGGLQIFEWAAIGCLVYWHHTCHDSPRCLRLGKYPAAGGLFRLCRHHHPDLQGERPRRELIHRMHREHKAVRI